MLSAARTTLLAVMKLAAPGNMAGVKRPVFTTLAAISLLLCAATVVMWVRSYWADDLWVLSQQPRSYFESDQGLAAIAITSGDAMHRNFSDYEIQCAGFSIRRTVIPFWSSR